MTRSSTKFLVAAALAGGMALAACGDEGPAQPPAVDLVANEAGFCRELAKALCNPTVVTACYGSVDKTLPDDTNKCIQAAALPAHCHTPGLPYHEVGAQGCIAAGAAAYADAKINADEQATFKKACLVAFSNAAPKGSKCGIDADCDANAGLRCLVKGDSGTCQVPRPVMNGEDCSAADSICSDEFYCDAGSHCVAKQTAGKSCDAKTPCVSTASCSIPMGMTAGTCAAKKGNGEACASPGECTGSFCVKPTGQTMGKCAAQVTLSQTDSESCSLFLL